MPTLNWIGKEAVVNHHQKVPFHLLKDVPSLSCGDPGSGNLIVQGDNLVALKALLPYYAGQVKCIYIDPPYNTGNEGWVYNDNVNSSAMKDWLQKVVGKEGEDFSRHDKWLCMMYPRLSLLRQFLRDDGAIFISIDDVEQAELKLVCDEVFGGQNFVDNLIWEKNYSPRNDAKYFSASHDFILVYAKNKFSWKRNLFPRGEKQNKFYKYDDGDGRGAWRPDNVLVKSFSQTGVFGIKNPNTAKLHYPPEGSCYRFNEEGSKKLLSENRLYFGKDGKGKPQLKRYLSEVLQGVVPQTIWKHEDVGHNQDGKKELNEVIDGNVFDSPKPTKLLCTILKVATNAEDLILDSFAGSGTTGHAVLQLNKQDGGNRKFILVEMEPKIASEITAERVRRVAQGYENSKGEKVEGLGGGFRYCELGEALFDESGQIRETVSFADLARHIYFTETGEPLPKERVSKTPFLGEYKGLGIYLLYNGILGDKSTNGGNVLNRAILAKLPKFDGQKVIYCSGCLLGAERLEVERIIIRQVPYEVKVS